MGLLATGFAWIALGPLAVGPFRLMTVHVGLAYILPFPLAWHVVARRQVLVSPAARGRRAALRLGAAAKAGDAFWWVAGWGVAEAKLAGARRRLTGPFETRNGTGVFPTVSWLFDAPSPVELGRWRLVVEGRVARRLELAPDDLSRLATVDLAPVLDCTGDWYMARRWDGVALGRLLEPAGAAPDPRSVLVESTTGYWRRFPWPEAAGYLLALRAAGAPAAGPVALTGVDPLGPGAR